MRNSSAKSGPCSVTYDVLIVGAGFTGATMARLLADAGQRVLIIDKRNHIGGNAYDYEDEQGVRVHKYGPHIFHTNSDRVFAFLSRFTEWRPYEHRVLSAVQGKLVPFPINLTTLEMLGLEHLRSPAEIGAHPANAEEQCFQRVGPELYEIFFKGYTQKMWGKHPRELDASVTARIPVRWDSRDDRYFTDKHQAMPKDGYAALFWRMLDHPNIHMALSYAYPTTPEARAWRQFPMPEKTIWTGPIDEYFGHCFGPLPYRSMRFETSLASTNACGAATVNYPDAATPWTRETQWALLAGSNDTMTPTTNEYPTAEGEPYYPIPCPEARALYKRYEALADAETNATFLGRLGRYQYINMDQAVGQAMAAFEKANPARDKHPA